MLTTHQHEDHMQAPDPIKIGYVRVSTAEQNTDRQLDGMQLTVTFTDKASGKNADRLQLQAMMAGNWPEGSTVYVHSMDRLARSLGDLLQIVEQLTQRGINVHFVKEAKVFRGGETSDPMDKLMLSMLGAVAEYERTLIRERQREGIIKAKARGVYRGRPRKNTDHERIAQIVTEATALGANKTRIAAKHGISRDTLYKYVKSLN
jgi:DNA invertase Pin-like site-specific DNA recombinase